MRKLKVVVLDDEQLSADGITLLIAKSNLPIEVTGTFYSSKEALVYLEKTPIDILITDLNMPELSGINLIKIVQQLQSDLQIIVLTGFGSLDYATEAMKYGVRYFLQKPSPPRMIFESLSNAIKDAERSKKSKLLESKQQIERVLRNEMEEGTFLTSFLMYPSTHHHILRPQIEKFLVKEEIEFIDGGMNEVVIYYLFTEKRLSKLVQSIDLSQVVDPIVIGYAENCTEQNMRQIFQQGLKYLNLKFYLEKSFIGEICEFKKTNDHQVTVFEETSRQFQYYLQNSSFSKSEVVFERLLIQAEKILLLPEILKQRIARLFESVLLKNGEDYELIVQLKKRIIDALNKSMLIDVINEILQILVTTKGSISKDNKISDNLNLIIEQNYGNSELSLKWAAKNILFLNAEYLGKTYQKETGKKFSTQLLEVRMHQAYKLLQKGKKVYEVAEQVGFGENADYFSRLFKSYFGYTPKKVYS